MVNNCDEMGSHYIIYKDKIPYLEVIVPYCCWNQAFNTVYFFMEYFCVGLGDMVYFISIETGEISEICVSMYFGYFYEHEKRLYVASGTSLYCFDCSCNLIWLSDNIAIDGVIINAFEKAAILVSCEMEPSGGWSNRHLSLENGKEIKEA